MRRIITLAFLLFTSTIAAHPADEFCVPGDGGLDPALCEELNAMQSSDSVRPLMDAGGNELSAAATLWLYTKVGIGHIIPGGLDHILFVLALMLTSIRLRPLVLQVTMFTFAHSITLGLAAAGWVSLNSAWVEALIAATIAFVAVENLFVRRLPKWRLPIVFLFGLLHGLGFAGFFGELSLPENQFWSGLIGFNLGVEVGQLSVLAVALLLALAIRRELPAERREKLFRRFVVVPGSLAIGAVGLVWTIERLLAV